MSASNPLKASKSLILSEKISKMDKYLPAHIVKKLYEVIDDIRDKAYIQYHIETGLRVSDVVNTEIVHIDWKNCRTYTYDHKKGEWRWVYWPEFVKSTLKMWLKQRQIMGIKDKRLFPFSEKTANRIIKRWVKKVGFHLADKVSSHWCRHTFIRLSRQAGRDIVAVRQNTGDTYKTLLEWYTGFNNEDMRKEIESKPLVED